MPPVDRSQPQISQEIENALLDEKSDADISNGTVLKDLIDVVASQLADAYSELETARLQTSVKNFDSISADALSQMALNWGVLRAAATKATGTVTFQSKTQPASRVTIIKNTVVKTLSEPDGSVIKYTTDSEVSLETTATLNPLTGYYEVDAAVTAQVAGTGSHVGVNSLVALDSKITGIDYITNKEAINNAEDEDDNETLADSLRDATDGTNLGTPDGIKEAILTQFGSTNILGVAVIGPYDSDNERAQYRNEVDVPIIPGTDALSFTSTLTTNGTDTVLFTDKRPVKTVTSVVGTTNGTNYQRNSDYGFDQDTGPVYGYSSRAFDGICWFPGRVLGPGVEITVQGTYTKRVRDTQDFLDDPARKYLTGDLLAKEAQKVLIDITLSATAESGVDRTQLATDISTAITEALADYELGDDILEDDIIKIVEEVAGVDGVDIPLTTLKKSTALSGSDDIDITAREYARAGTLSVSVS